MRHAARGVLVAASGALIVTTPRTRIEPEALIGEEALAGLVNAPPALVIFRTSQGFECTRGALLRPVEMGLFLTTPSLLLNIFVHRKFEIK